MPNTSSTSTVNRWLIAHAIVSTAALVALTARQLSIATHLDTGLIHARGIVLQDSLGRDRILIGAPFPFSADRIRTDTAKVRAAWAKDLGGDAYMGWYRDHRHSGNGLLVLNAAGYDQLVLGDELPDPNTGRRITVPTGLLWNDTLGFERGGLGLNRLIEGGRYRNGLGLDDEAGEGLHLFILEDGSKFLRTVYDEGVLYQGRFAAHGLLGDTSAFVGHRLMNADGTVVAQERYAPAR
jgi:hypothetical protein